MKMEEDDMKKRTLALALAAVMAFGIAGCGGEKAEENNAVNNAVQQLSFRHRCLKQVKKLR